MLAILFCGSARGSRIASSHLSAASSKPNWKVLRNFARRRNRMKSAGHNWRCFDFFGHVADRHHSGYIRSMIHKIILLSVGIYIVLTVPLIRADQVEMLNGDRLSGRVLSVTTETVVLQSDVLGRVNVPRQKIATVSFRTNTAPETGTIINSRTSLQTASQSGNSPIALVNTNMPLAASFGGPGDDTNVVRQIREQMLAGNPAASAKFDELANGLMSGKLNMEDLRREAKASADQLRELQRQDPEAAASLDGYLQVLDSFLNEPVDVPAVTTPPSQPNSQSH
jgi:hypothetical protein